MLEYLFTFMEKNIVLIFLCVLFLGIASVYSKGIKFLFLSIVGTAALYFALLCLYRLGIGIDVLYNWSSQIVIQICKQIDYYNLFCAHHSVLFSKILEVLSYRSFSNGLIWITQLILVLCILLAAKDILLINFKIAGVKKVFFNYNVGNKNEEITNTINRTQSKFIFYSVLRC
ncbi:MAG: hypothetical protein K2N64_03170 [Anaeroplasmataceae bacterium]|nr:hypothetical protein [Anaeroplasmataceae bacterium]